MQQHSQYWRGLMKQGMVIAFGPVADPKASFGVAIVQVEDDTDPASLGTNDPTIKADAGFNFEIHPMPRLVLPGEVT